MTHTPEADATNLADSLSPDATASALRSKLMTTLAQYLHLDDTDPISVVLAAAVSKSLDGPPLWIMVVGPSSGGKSELVSLLDGAVDDRLDEVTAPALLSWSKPVGPKQTQVPTGVLERIGASGLVAISDFSTVLATSNRGGRDQLFALLRRAFDGRVQRDLGNQHRPLIWEGRLTLVAGCTPAIDDYSAHADGLGPRWLYCRMSPLNDSEKRSVVRAGRCSDRDENRRAAARFAKELIEDAAARVATAELSDKLLRLVEDAALFVCSGRAAVPREAWGSRDVCGVPQAEEPGRIGHQLGMLARCLIALSLGEADVARIVCRSAVDSMPGVRRQVLHQVVDAHPTPVTAAVVARTIRSDHKVAGRHLADLQAVGLVDPAYDNPDLAKWDIDAKGAAIPKPWRLAADSAVTLRMFRVASGQPGWSDGGQDVASDPLPPKESGAGTASTGFVAHLVPRSTSRNVPRGRLGG